MLYKGLEYSVVQLTEGAGWQWEVRFDDGKTKSGLTPVSRAWPSNRLSMRSIAP
jgi:hypothetical protein